MNKAAIVTASGDGGDAASDEGGVKAPQAPRSGTMKAKVQSIPNALVTKIANLRMRSQIFGRQHCLLN